MKFKAQNLSIGYQNKEVVHHINFEVNSGDFVVLIGKNGKGKSTLLKTMAQIISPISGDVFINEQSLKQLSPRQIANNIGIVLTSKPEIEMQVKEILHLGRHAFTNFYDKLSKTDIKVIDNIVELMDIKHLLGRSILELSDGEQQKVMIARTLAQETPIILLDEPTTHLDLENKALILKLLKKITKEQKKIVIFSTHDLNLTLPIVDKLWLIDQKKMIENSISQDTISNQISNLFNNKDIAYDSDCHKFKLV